MQNFPLYDYENQERINNTSAKLTVRETGVSRHNGGSLRAPLNPRQYDSAVMENRQ